MTAAPVPPVPDVREAVVLHSDTCPCDDPAFVVRQVVVATLAKHQPHGFSCACGWRNETATYASAHRAHLADAVLAVPAIATALGRDA